jgi:arylsulfatase A-like enzyme
MTPSLFLRGCALVLALTLNAVAAPAATPTARPNIVFIMADDLGYGDVACYGRPDVRTPAIDRLAERGVKFTQAYANSCVCTASRVALITGRYQYRLRVGLEEPIASVGSEGVGLPPEHPTLPSLLKAAGYRTMLIGKWHLGALPRFGPLLSGYEHFYGYRGGGVDYFLHGGTKPDFWSDDTPIQQEGYLTDLLGQRAVEAIDAHARARETFFISLHFSAPHWPWEGPNDEAEARRLGGRGLTHHDGGSQKTYVEMIEAMDRQIGRVTAALERNGLAENTIVVFTSDNGGERFSYTWPFTGRKSELLEGGLRVPAVIRWPARIAPGRVSEQVMIHMDWLPTLLAAAGSAPDPRFPSDGLNLVPHLTQDAPVLGRQLFWRYKANGQQAVRHGDLKFLRILENTFLFNLADDPMERANLSARRKEDHGHLARAWYDWNLTMLPLIEESYTYAFNGTDLADHIGQKPPRKKPEPAPRPED